MNLIGKEKDNGGPGNEIKGGKYSTGEHTIMQFFFLTGWGAIIFTLIFSRILPSTLESRINVLHVYLFLRVFSVQHALIGTNMFI